MSLKLSLLFSMLLSLLMVTSTRSFMSTHKVKSILLALLMSCMSVSHASSGGSNSFADASVEDSALLINVASQVNSDVFHVFTHGKPGELLINDQWLNAEKIADFLQNNAQYSSLKTQAINIYGCEFAKGEKGQQAVAYLENTLGLQVNASTNITGKDGDWILETNPSNSNLRINNYNYNLQIANTGPDDDYDGDNIPNSDDLDDDNDGILDTVECSELVTNLVSDGGFAGTQAEVNASGWYASTSASNFETTTAPVSTYSSTNHNSTLTGGLFDELGSNNANTGLKNVLFEYNSFTNAIVYDYGLLNQGELEYSFDLGARGTGSSNEFVVQVWDADNDVVVSTIEQDAFNTLPDYNASPAFKNFSGTVTLPQTGNYYLLFRGTGTSSFVDDYLIDRVASRYLVATCDLDNDGIPNHLDLDSDGDGCPDALEGAGTFTASDLQTSTIDGGNTGADYNGTAGPVQDNLGTTVDQDASSDTYGVPIVSPATSAVVQGVGSSQNASLISYECRCIVGASKDGTPTATDNDGDGLNNICDLDDDNDGILDFDEGLCNSAEVAFEFGETTISNAQYALSSDIDYTQMQTIQGQPSPTAPRVFLNAYDEVAGGSVYDHTFDHPEKIWVDGDGKITVVIQYYDNISSSTGRYTKNPRDFNIKINSTTTPLLYGSFTISSADAAILDDGGWVEYTIVFDTDVEPFSVVEIEGIAGLLEGNELGNPGVFNPSLTEVFALSVGAISGCSESIDTDDDGVPDYLDVDSDNDGCPDALEGAGSYTAADLTSSNNLTDGDEGTVDPATGVPNNGGDQTQDSDSGVVEAFNLTVADIPDVSENIGSNVTFTAMPTGITTTTWSTDGNGTPDYAIPPATDVSTGYIYQWQLNGVDISGATSDSYTVNNIQLEDDADVYTVIVSHSDMQCPVSEPATLKITPMPSIAVIKDGTFVDAAPIGETNVGDTINYTFTVTNTGDVDLTGVTVTDPLVTVSGGPLASLAVGATDSATFTAAYTITQVDIDTGSVSNQATATGTPPATTDNPTPAAVTDASDDNSNTENDVTVTTLDQMPSIAVIKEGTFVDAAPIGETNVGDTIDYTFTVTNTGNTVLNNVSVSDPLVTVSGGPLASLAVGATDSTTFTATYTITQADINTGSVSNQATATGKDPEGNDVTDQSDDNSNTENDVTVTTLDQMPGIAVIKEGTFVDAAPLGEVNAGDAIEYTFTVTNIGNIELTNVTVTDPLVAVSGGPLASLAVGAVDATTFTATYILTQNDVDVGSVTNRATAQGTPPVTAGNSNPTPVTDRSDHTNNERDRHTVISLGDADGDGILDDDDLDDDNDGILDTVEGQCSSVTDYEIFGTFGTLSGNTNAVNRPLDNPAPTGYTFGGNGADPVYNAGTYVVTNGANANNIHPNTIWDDMRGHTTGLDDDAFVAINGSTVQATFYADTVTLTAGTTYEYGAWVAYGLDIDESSTSVSEVNIRIIKVSTGAVVADFDSGAIHQKEWREVSSTYVPDSTEAYRYELRNISLRSDGNDFALDDAFLLDISCFELDTDNDGIPNRLDLDSDGDGCPDAIEGAGSFTASDIFVTTLPGGNSDGDPAYSGGNGPVNVNLTGSPVAAGAVGTTGIPIVVDQVNGQAAGDSQRFSLETACCSDASSYPNIIDSDGDNIGDACDLDDDNDGILDTDEFCNSQSEPFTSLGMARNVVSAGIYDFNLNGEEFSTYVDIDGYVQVAIDFGGSSGDLGQGDTLNNTVRGILQPSVLSELTEATEVRVSYTGTTKAALDVVSTNTTLLQRVTTNTTLHQGSADNGINDSWTGVNPVALTGDASSSLATGGGTSLHENIFHPRGNSNGFHWIPSNDNQRVTYSEGEIAADESLQLWVRAPAETLPRCNDIDNDNIPNHLDLDSDGDGCPDAIEGGGNYTEADLVGSSIDGGSTDVTQNFASSTVDGDGVPNSGTSQTVGDSQTYATDTTCCLDASNHSNFTDSDGDNIGDFCDLDDDNDGILDVVENCTTEIISFNGSTWLAPNGIDEGITVNTSVDVTSSTITERTLSAAQVASYLVEDFYQYSSTNDQLINPAGNTNSSTITFTFSTAIKASEVGLFIGDVHTKSSTGNLSVSGGTATPEDFQWARTTSSRVYENDGLLIPFYYDNSTGDFSYPHLDTGEYSHNILKGDSEKTLTSLTLTIDNLNGGDLVSIRLLPIVGCIHDIDGDGISDYLDTDSDNDGCPDAVEGAGSYTAADLTSSNNLTDGDEGTVNPATGVPNNGGDQTQGNDSDVTEAFNLTVADIPDVSENIGSNVTFTAMPTGITTATWSTDGNGTPNYAVPPATEVSTGYIYQWQLNGVDISGATSDSYTVNNIQLEDDADVYTVIVSHSDMQCPVSEPATLKITTMPSLAVIKDGTFVDAAPIGETNVGDTINYTFTVTNTGDVDLTGVTVTDPLVTVSGGPLASLAVGAVDSTTFTASYAITQSDIDAGGVTNQATASGTPPATTDNPNPASVTDQSDDNSNTENDVTVTTLDQMPGIAIIKTGTFTDVAPLGETNAGDTIEYTFTVTNTGNTTLTNVTVTDPLVTVSGGPIASLAVGAVDSTTFTASYTITQADIDTGSVSNQATATGKDPEGNDVTDQSDDNSNTENDVTVTTLDQMPGIAIIKTGTFTDVAPLGETNAGDTIEYTFTVTNTGNTTLTNVTVTDPLVTVSGGPIASLAVGAVDSTTFTASYTITQADIDTGSVSNQATATGKDPEGNDVTDQSDDNSNTENDVTVTTLDQMPGIAIIKTGTFTDVAPLGETNAGDTIEYTFTVTNTGNTSLTNVTVTDPLVTVSGGPIASLAVGAVDSTTFTASYTITQADIDTGSVSNQATATGKDPEGNDVTDQSDDNSNTENDVTVTTLDQMPGIAIIKTGTFTDVAPLGETNAGDTIEYTFTVTNTGNTSLTNVTVTDPLVTVSGGPIASLAVGAVDSTTFTASYTITQADINTGSVSNQATATGKDPEGNDVTDQSDDDSNTENDVTVTTLDQMPGIAIIKTGTFTDAAPLGETNAGDTIEYTFTVTNTGNTTLTNVTVTDPLVTVSGGPIASLAVGAVDSTTFTASYTITQADIDTGSVSNQATATGKDPEGNDVTDQSDDNSNTENDVTVTTLDQMPGIAIIKTGTFTDVAPLGETNAGDTIEYTFTVTNTGNTTLTNVTVTDPLVTVSGGPIASLAVGAVDSTTFTASYTITQADIDTGSVSNQATATGKDPEGNDVTDQSDDNSNTENDVTVTTLDQMPGIAIIKTGTFTDVAPLGETNAGDTIEYTFTVTNTGNTSLTNVTVTDPLVTVSGGPIASLAVGAVDSTTFTASYVITQEDIEEGSVSNQATATGKDPEGNDVTDQSDDDSNTENDVTVTTLDQMPGIAIIKTGTFTDAAPLGETNAGDTIEYTFTVTNTGNTSLTNVTVTDPLVTVSGGPIASLAVGAVDSTTFTASYVITQEDIEEGSVSNQATATGKDPEGNDVTDQSDDDSNTENDVTVTTLDQMPGIAIIKTGTFTDAAPLGETNAGDTIEYTFTVTNTGNTTLTNVTVTDPLVTVSGGPIASLAVGAVDSTTFTASYTITQADINTGSVSNQATATGKDPEGNDVTDQSDDDSNTENDVTVTTLDQMPGIAIIKTGTFTDAAPLGETNAGDTIEYTFTVTNTGNTTLTNVTVTDPLVTVSGGPIASLAVGAVDSTTFTASYTITQADIDTGSVSNQATATGKDPEGNDVTDQSDDNSNTENDVTVTTLDQMPGIAIIKTGTFTDVAPLGETNAGDTIEYTFTVTNTGNTTLTNVTVTDPLVTVSGGPIASLAVGAVDSTTFTASYTITQADIDTGSVSNQATATGKDPEGNDVTDQSDDNSNTENDVTVTTLDQMPGIAIIKTGTFTDVAPLGETNAGDTIEYTFTVTNTGNTTLTNVTVTDPLVTVSGGPIASLAVGAVDSTTFTASYTITQADIDTGSVSNQATATGKDPEGNDVTDQSDDDSNTENDVTVTTLDQMPGIAIIKTGTFTDVAPLGETNAGDTIEYTFTVTNTGNTTLTNVTVTDPLVTVSGGPIASLAVGAVDSTTFTASYVITQEDIEEGSVSNQATATGTPPATAANPTPTPVADLSDDDSNLENDVTVTDLDQMPGIAIIKIGTYRDAAVPDDVSIGDVIDYVFTVTNTGNVPLSNVIVTDPLVTVEGGPLATLAIGATDSTTFTASYVITQADIDTGSVSNQAIASGTPPATAANPTPTPVTDLSDDDNVLEDDPTVTAISQLPSIGVQKTLVGGVATTLEDNTYEFAYNIMITNTGNVRVSNVNLEDDLVAMVNVPTINGGEFFGPEVTSPNGDLTPNDDYDGRTDVNLLSGTDVLEVGASALITLTVMFKPKTYYGPFVNTVIATAQGADDSQTVTDSDTAQIDLVVPVTPITLGWFESQESGASIVFKWATETETSNAGFYLSVKDASGNWHPFNGEIIETQGDSTEVQNYEYIGLGIEGDEFMITDVSTSGKEKQHGPFMLGEQYGVKANHKITNWDLIQSESERKELQREEENRQQLEKRLQDLRPGSLLMPSNDSDKTMNEKEVRYQGVSGWARMAGVLLSALVAPAQAIDVVSFEVEQAGLYKVTHAQLTAKGVNLDGIEVVRIGLKQANQWWPLKVYPEGSTVFGSNSSLVFPGNGLTTLYSGLNKYTLVLDDGTPLSIEPNDSVIPENTAPAKSYLAEKSYAPQNHYSQTSPSQDDSWYADSLKAFSEPVSKEISLQVTDYAPALNGGFNRGNIARSTTPRPRLEVNLWGNSDLGGNGVTNPDHHVMIEFNGEVIASERFDGLRYYKSSKVPTNMNHGNNIVKVTLPKDHGYKLDLVNLDSIILRYPRLFKAEFNGNALVFESPWNFFKVNDLTSDDVTVIRIDGSAQKGYKGYEMLTRGTSQSCNNDCALFAGSRVGEVSRYYVATNNGFKSPTIRVLAPGEDIESGNANYLVIAHPDFINTSGAVLEGYVSQLANEYGSADIVNVESIYGHYSGHVVDATAIQRYIQSAYANRNTRHVMLVGGDTYDYHGYLDSNSKSFIPSLYVQIASNVNAVPSDAQYADIDEDFVPDMTITRLPVRTTAELRNMLSKRRHYLARSYQDKVVFAADEVDAGGYSFKNDAQDAISAHFSNDDVRAVFVDDVGIATGKQALSTAFNAGASLVSYYGHSSAHRWSLDGLFTSDDVVGLNNANRPAVVAQWGCWNTFYVNPNEDSLVHRFLVEGTSGAVTVMGASSLAKASAEKRMADLLYDRLKEGMNIGDAVLSAKRALAVETPYQLDILLGWAVLGPDDISVF